MHRRGREKTRKRFCKKECVAALLSPAEAATEKEFVERVKYYGKHFGLMYENVAMHNEKRCVADDFSEKGT